MESLLASQDNDEILPMVNYKLAGNAASYIVRRDEATFLVVLSRLDLIQFA